MNRILFSFIFISLTASCKFVYHRAPNYLKKNGYTYRYTGQPTDLGKQLDINGYFLDVKSHDAKNSNRGYDVVFFFDDGMFVRCTESLGPPGTSINDNFRIMDSLRRMGKQYSYFNERQEWGYYRVIGDTIKVQSIRRPPLGGSHRFWAAYERAFVIAERNSVREISILPIHKLSPHEPHTKYHIPEEKQWRGVLVRPGLTPSSDGWIKYEKWFWQDKSAFEAWIGSKAN